jgi:hypothetical protein
MDNKKRIIKLVFILPILLILLVVVIESSRLLFTWFKIENALRIGMHYATTGMYDVTYCLDADNDGTACDGLRKIGEIDAARIPSIQNEVLRNMQGIQFNRTLEDTEDGYVRVIVCLSNTNHDAFVYTELGKPLFAKCIPGEDPGEPGQRVIIAVEYNFSFLTLPVFGIGPHILHLTFHREGINEEFRTSRRGNMPPVAYP